MVVVRVLCGLAAVVILVIVAERMFPLRSVGRDRWEWELRPAGRFPRIDRAGWAQVVAFTVLGAGVGGLLRLAVGLRRPRRLSAVLANGTTRAMTTASHQLFDSESAANIYAATWLRDAPVRSRPVRGPVLPALMLRRIIRRGHIPLLFVTVAFVAAAVGDAAGVVGRSLLVLVCAVLASAVWRATGLGVLGGDRLACGVPVRGRAVGCRRAVLHRGSCVPRPRGCRDVRRRGGGRTAERTPPCQRRFRHHGDRTVQYPDGDAELLGCRVDRGDPGGRRGGYVVNAAPGQSRGGERDSGAMICRCRTTGATDPGT
jgi:hypothetical protein